jgi:hypothetical protein
MALHTQSRDNWITQSSSINVITAIILKAAMLVLLMGGIYEVCRLDDLVWHDIYTDFHVVWYSRSSNIKALPQQFLRL